MTQKRSKISATEVVWAPREPSQRCGHGVQFYHSAAPDVVIAFAVGFEWLHKPGTPVEVEVLVVPPDGTSQQRWTTVVDEVRAGVRRYFDKPRELQSSTGNRHVTIWING
jgi:hypothetical protein